MSWLEVIGIGSLCYVAYLVSCAVYRLFIRKMSLDKYRKGRNCWAIVTGASDGIGMGFVRVLAKNNFNVLLISRNAEKLKRCVEELTEEFKPVKFDYCVSDASDLSSIGKIEDYIKDKDIAILINNVGINQGEAEKLEGIPNDILQKIVTVNCMYPLLLTKALLPILKERKHAGAIVNISSVSAQIHTPFQTTYSAAKAFTRFFSMSLSGELVGNSIDVLSVEPGYVATSLTKMKKGGLVCDAEECADGALRQLGLVEAVPHWKHFLFFTFLRLLLHFVTPSSVQPYITNRIMRGMALKRYGKRIL